MANPLEQAFGPMVADMMFRGRPGDPNNALAQTLLDALAPASTPGLATPTPGFGGPVQQQAPLPTQQPLVAEPEPLSKGQRIAGGLADAVNRYLSFKYGRPQQESVLESRRQHAEAQARRKTQENILRQRQLQMEADRTARATETAAERKFRSGESAAERKARANIETARLKQREQERVSREKIAEANIKATYDGIKARSGELTAGQIKRREELRDEFITRIEEMESVPDDTLFENVKDPNMIRELFYRQLARRFDQDEAKELAREFEQVVGKRIDDAMQSSQAPEATRPAGLLDIPLTWGGTFNPVETLMNAPVDFMEFLRDLPGPSRIRNPAAE